MTIQAPVGRLDKLMLKAPKITTSMVSINDAAYHHYGQYTNDAAYHQYGQYTNDAAYHHDQYGQYK